MTLPTPRTANPARHRRTPLLAAIGLAAALALTSCQTATPYQPISSAAPSRGGYSDRRIAPGVWQVSFSGNSLTSRATVEGYLLYRAAELTLQQGYDWFEVVNRNTEHNVREEPVPYPQPGYGPYSPWWGYDYWRPYWRYYYPSYGWRMWSPFWNEPFFDTRRVERYQASAEIEMHKGPAPADHHRVFDAHQVIARLGPTIKRPGNVPR